MALVILISSIICQNSLLWPVADSSLQVLKLWKLDAGQRIAFTKKPVVQYIKSSMILGIVDETGECAIFTLWHNDVQLDMIQLSVAQDQ